MAGLFVSASSQYLTHASGLGFSDPPFTMVCWFRPTSTGAHSIMALATAGVSGQYNGLITNSSTLLIARTRTSVNSSSVTVGALTANVWNFCGGVWASTASRIAYLNSEVAAEETTDRNTTAPDLLNIGKGSGTDTSYCDARIAEVGIWNVALTSAEMASLSKGFSPLLIRPTSLVFYAPLIRDLTQDLIGGLTLTNSGGVTVAEHKPGMFYPQLAMQFPFAGVSPPPPPPPSDQFFFHRFS